MMKHIVSLTVPVLVAALAACSDDSPTAVKNPEDGVVCTAEARSGISVTVVDSISGQAVNTTPIVVAREGAYADTSYHFASPSVGPYGLVYERPGIYAVTVSATGYKPWTMDNVVVAKGVCHVSTVLLTAKLQK